MAAGSPYGANDAQMQQSLAQVQQMAGSAQGLVAAAASGGFALEPSAADTLIKSCQDALDTLRVAEQHNFIISQEPKLGMTPGAKVVAPFTASVATHPTMGMVPALQTFKATLQQMLQAYQQAKQNYLNTEHAVNDSLRRQG